MSVSVAVGGYICVAIAVWVGVWLCGVEGRFHGVAICLGLDVSVWGEGVNNTYRGKAALFSRPLSS